MSIQFTVQEAATSRNSRDSIANLEDFGVSSFILHEEERITQNLEAAARANSDAGAVLVYCTHWAGDTEPVVAANQLAFLDHRLFGRFGLRVAEQPDTGLGHEAAWRRTDEYLTLLKRLWSNEKPFDHECEFYSVQKGVVEPKGPQGALIPIRMTGLTGTAIQVCARHATTFDIAFGSITEVGSIIAKLRESAGQVGRPRSISFALRIPEEAIARIAGWPTSGDVQDLEDLLRTYADIGVSEFVFDVETLGRLGRARVRDLKSALEDSRIKAPAALEHPHFGRTARQLN